MSKNEDSRLAFVIPDSAKDYDTILEMLLGFTENGGIIFSMFPRQLMVWNDTNTGVVNLMEWSEELKGYIGITMIPKGTPLTIVARMKDEARKL